MFAGCVHSGDQVNAIFTWALILLICNTQYTSSKKCIKRTCFYC